MYTRWRLYILAVFLLLIGGMLLGVRFLRRRGVPVSNVQAALFMVGMVLIVESLIISTLSNFNLGVILPAFFGVPLVALAFLLPHMRHGFLCGLKWFVVGCYGVAILIFLVCGVLILSGQHRQEDVQADAIIVLGAAVHGDKVTWVLENRLNTAKTYLDEHPDALCIVSGGQGAGESVSEASAMKKYLVERGVEPDRVVLEDRATNTIENFRYSKDIIDRRIGPDACIGFVTTNFHCYRAGRVALAEGVDAVGIPAPDVWYLTVNNFLRECVGICVYSLRGDFESGGL